MRVSVCTSVPAKQVNCVRMYRLRSTVDYARVRPLAALGSVCVRAVCVCVCVCQVLLRQCLFKAICATCGLKEAIGLQRRLSVSAYLSAYETHALKGAVR